MKALFLILLAALPAYGEVQPSQKDVYGWIEKIRLYPSRIIVHAKLDTGADGSSIHAENIRLVKKNGKKYINFTVKNRSGRKDRLSRPLKRVVKIKRTGGRREERFVVRMALCLGDIYQKVDVNLEDRSDFSYAMLVGRNFLEGQALIDPAAMYQTEPRCKQ